MSSFFGYRRIAADLEMNLRKRFPLIPNLADNSLKANPTFNSLPVVQSNPPVVLASLSAAGSNIPKANSPVLSNENHGLSVSSSHYRHLEVNSNASVLHKFARSLQTIEVERQRLRENIKVSVEYPFIFPDLSEFLERTSFECFPSSKLQFHACICPYYSTFL